MSTVDLSYKSQPNCYDLKHIPGDDGLPLVGRTFELFRDLYGMVDDQYKKYGPVSRIGLIGQKSILVSGPDFNKTIYLDTDRNFSAEMGYFETLGQFYGGGLLMRDLDDHKLQRRIFQTAFKNDAMRHYTEMMNPIMAANLKSWEKKPDFHFFPHIKETLLDASATIFLGITDFKGSEARRISQAFIDIAEGMVGIFRWDSPLVPWLKFRKGLVAKRYMEDYLRTQIPTRRAGNSVDMFSFLCRERHPETGDYFADQDIVAHINFLLFAAHDTTTSNLSYIMQHLGEDTAWQDAARKETMSLSKEWLDYDDLANMHVLENIQHEALRLHPSVQMMSRRTIRECEMGGHRIPANTLISIAPTYTHLMPEYWSNPTTFDPDRWTPERAEHKRHPFQFIGFGGGAHKCIGMHFAGMIVKTFMHQMLQKYQWNVPTGYAPQHKFVPMPKQSDDLPLELHAIS